MKRKIFTSLAAAGLLACTVVTASAAQRVSKPVCFRFGWQCPGYVTQQPCPDFSPVLPETPEQNPSPIQPDAPTEDSTPVQPDAPVENPAPIQPDAPEQDDGAMSQLETAACQLINQQRAAYGLAPLTIDADLSIKARIKSQDMRDQGYFSHTSPTYGSPFSMMQSLGITYRSAGENIAKGYATAEAVVNAWMASDGHRANILSTRYTSMGIGYVDGYWTQWFIG